MPNLNPSHLSLLKKLASDAAIYGLSSIVSRLLNYFLVPLYTAVFAAAAYGEVSVFYAYAAFLNVVYTFGLETTYFRFVTKDKPAQAQYFNLAISGILGLGALLSVPLWLGADPLAEFIGYPGHGQYVRYFAIILWVDALVAIPYARLRLEKKAKRFAALKTANILTNALLNLFFLYGCSGVLAGNFLPGLQPWAAAIYDPAQAIGYVFLANVLASVAQLPFFWAHWRGFGFTLGWGRLQPMLAYAYPLMFMGLAGIVNETIDRQVLKYWLPEGFYPGVDNDAAVGIYSACYKLSIFISLATQAFRYSAEPFFFAQGGDQNSPRLFAKVMKYFVIVLAVMYLAVGANVDFLANIFITRKEYHAGLGIVPVLLLANVLLGVYYNLTVWFKLTEKTEFGTWFSLAGAVVTVLANLLLVPLVGYMGSAIGHLACYLVLCGLCYFYGQKYYPIPYQVGSALGYLGLATLLMLPTYLWKTDSQWLNLALGSGLTLVFLAVVWVRERRELRLG